MTHIKTFFIVALLLLVFDLGTNLQASDKSVFRFSLSEAPQSFDPAGFYSTESNNFFFNIYRGLFKYDDARGVVPENAKNCKWQTKLKLICHLKKDFLWSDGSPVIAQDYVRAFRYLINPKSKARGVKYLLRLKNAEKILAGKLPTEELGIDASKKFELVFRFEKEDAEFIEKLTSKSLVPWRIMPSLDLATNHPENFLCNGPYKIKSFNKEKGAYLVPNKYYPSGNPTRPDVEVYFVAEDSTALNLFDTGRTDLLMRLDFSLVPKYKNLKSFFTKELIRFDYIGFGTEIENNIHFRKALALSLDYSEFQKIVISSKQQGCPGLGSEFTNKDVCYKFDLSLAKKEWDLVPKSLRNKTWTMRYSLTGGDSVLQMVQWYQNQWKKNLGMNIDLQGVEQGMYLQELRITKQDIFRKGVNLDRPTCTSALENFESKSLDNYIHFKNPRYDELIEKLKTTTNKNQKKDFCYQAIKILMDEYRIIPQGPMVYSMLDDHKFKNFHINNFLQLDLADLEVAR